MSMTSNPIFFFLIWVDWKSLTTIGGCMPNFTPISMFKTKQCKHKIWCQIILICWKRTLMWNPKTAMRYTTFVLCINRPVICCTCINSNKNYLNSFSQIFHSFCFSFLSPLFLCLNRKSENNLNNLLNKNVEDWFLDKLDLKNNNNKIWNQQNALCNLQIGPPRGVVRGGGYGAKPPGPVKSIDFRVLSPYLKRKKFKSPLDKLLTTSLSPCEVHQHAAWNPLFNTVFRIHIILIWIWIRIRIRGSVSVIMDPDPDPESGSWYGSGSGS